MSNFDWQNFLDRERIEYSDRGPSTSKDNLYVACPFCGDGDQGRHMGISTKSRGWGCWKDSSHRGIAPTRLIKALLGCSWDEAARIGQAAKSAPASGSDYLASIKRALGQGDVPKSAPTLLMPDSFKRYNDYACNVPWGSYLVDDRGYAPGDAAWIAKRFDIRTTTDIHSKWAYRVIIPVYDENLNLVTWTARSTADRVQPRYKTLTATPDLESENHHEPIAVGPITNYLLDMPHVVEGGDFLVICEGPFDVFRLVLYAGDHGGRVTCLFGKTISLTQIDTLAEIRDRYKAVFLLLDEDAYMAALKLSSQLQPLGIQPIKLGKDFDDPGSMNARAANVILSHMSRLSLTRP